MSSSSPTFTPITIRNFRQNIALQRRIVGVKATGFSEHIIAVCDAVYSGREVEEGACTVSGILLHQNSNFARLSASPHLHIELGLPSPGVGGKHPSLAHSGAARFSLTIDSDFAEQVIFFTDPHNNKIGRLELIYGENIESGPIDSHQFRAVTYEENNFVFILDNLSDSIQGGFTNKGRIYEEKILKYLREIVHEGATIYDVGSNIGNHAVIFSKVFLAREVTVFEPFKRMVDLLMINLALNNCNNVNVAYLGLGSGPIRGIPILSGS